MKKIIDMLGFKIGVGLSDLGKRNVTLSMSGDSVMWIKEDERTSKFEDDERKVTKEIEELFMELKEDIEGVMHRHGYKKHEIKYL
jgi:hypothetical protein